MSETAGGVTSLYISYWSLRDPLFQTQGLAYLRELTKAGHRFALITFEQPQHALDPARAAEAKRELAAEGIYWYPLRYHKRFPLLATAYDCLAGVAAGLVAARRHRARVVHTRASIPAAMGLAVSRLCGLKFLYDADSVLSEEYVDAGHWARGGLPYRALAWFEGRARRSADRAVVLTEPLRRDFLEHYGVRAPVHVVPCCVDTERFRFDPAAREQRRAQLGLGEERLFVYVGKIGSWYSVDETFEFFKAARELAGRSRLLVLTGDPPELFHEAAARTGVGAGDYHVTRAGHEEVAGWLSAADAGLAFIRSLPSKRGSSPVKVGEYLACGLPVVMTPEIGDYSALIERERVGVVVRSLTPGGYEEGARRLVELWAEGGELSRRCRAAAEASVSLAGVGGERYREIYEGLLKRPPSR